MPKIHVVFDDPGWVDAEFVGHLYPDGPNGYSVKGTLKAQCLLDRRRESFANTVALDYGGKSMPWSDLKREIVGEEWNTFDVSWDGERKPGEDVAFRVGINTGLSGQYEFGSTVTSPVGGPPQRIDERFTGGDITAIVRAEAWADGPKGDVIDGMVNASVGRQSIMNDKATFGHKGASGSWSYETASHESGRDFQVHGTRKSGEDLRLVMGTTDGNFGRWVYGDEITLKLPENF
nr:hypothetical protein OH826_19875 [Streptomyces sp. NBC_00899]